MSFLKDHKYFILGFLALCLVGFLSYTYIQSVQEKNAIAREQILEQQQAREEEGARLKAKDEQDAALAQEKLQQSQEASRQAAQQKAADAEAAQVTEYRKECKAVQDANQKSYEDFLNTCTSYNTLDYCDGTPAGQLFISDFQPGWIQTCITSKQKTGW